MTGGGPTTNFALEALAERWTEAGLAGPSERELLIPEGMEVGSADHLRFLTLPRAISGLYPEIGLWQRAGAAWADKATHWLFDTAQVAYADWRAVEKALAPHGLAEHRQDVRGWYEVARGLQGRFKGDVASLIAAGPKGQPARTSAILAYLDASSTTFPFLSGDKTARLWLDQLRRIGGIEIIEDEPLRLAPSKEARDIAATHGLSLPSRALPIQQLLALEAWAALDGDEREAILQGIQAQG
ncbi:MAG: hypothetical protein ACRDIB_14725 [Ardenticatenaceae bacterium]